VADAIIKSVADDGIVCRWGGEEFLAILELTAQEGYKRAEEMRQRLCEALLRTEGYTITLSMTVGFATSHDTRDTEELIHLVDERLYKGKNKGKNQVVAE
jgi:diguanylate cyclase